MTPKHAAALLLVLAACAASAPARWDDREAGRPVLQVLTPEVRSEDQGNWSVVRDRRGRLYVGNDRVVEYDGRTWSSIDLGGGFQVGGMALGEDDRIWVAAEGEVGFLEEDAAGARVYRSLRHFLPPGVRVSDPWGVHRLKGRTLFVAAQEVLIWDGERFEVHPMPSPISRRLFSFPLRGGIAISQPDVGLWLWNGETLSPINLKGGEKQSICFAAGTPDGSELFVTRGGLGRFAQGRFTLVDTGENSLFEGTNGTTGVVLPDGNICFATFAAGLIILQSDGTLIRVLDRSQGLSSIECSALFLDDQNGLWVAARRAIFRLDATNAETLFDSLNGLDKGAARMAAPFRGSIAVLGDQGILAIDRTAPTARFAPIARHDSLFLDAVEWPAGHLLASAIGPVLTFNPPEEPVVALSGSRWIARILPVPDLTNLLLIAEGTDVIEVQRVGSRLERVGPPRLTLTDEPNDLALDARGTLWASTPRGGLFFVSYPGGTLASARNWKRGAELPPDFDSPSLFTLGGQVGAYTARHAFLLSGHNDGGPQEILPGLGLIAVERAGENDVWAVAAPAGDVPRLVRIGRSGEAWRVTAMDCRGLAAVGRALSLARDKAGHALWIGGSNGLLRVALAELALEPPPPPPLVLRAGWTDADGTRALPLDGGARLAFRSQGTLSFELRDARDVLGESGRIEARLRGEEERWTKAGKVRTYVGLRERRYTLEVRALDFAGRPGPVTTYGFSIAPPWHRTLWAYAGYLALGLGAIWGGVVLRTRRVARLNVQLEHNVHARTEELTRAVAARSAFLANMGHEIRNPLNGVVGLVESLRARQLPPHEQQRFIAQLASCATQLASVVEDVMEYARVDAGRVTLRLRNFAIREPVGATLDVFQAAQPDRDIALDASAADLQAQVRGDPDRLRQILVNYLANALKFGGDGPVTLRVRREGEQFTFSVIDRGPGISREEQAQLFSRFTRGSLAQKLGIPGTGLGLAVCKAYAEAMGGSVGVESEPGRGATFSLGLPLRAPTEADTAPTTVATDIMAGRTALVVDDHEFNRVVFADLLGRMGAQATTAADIPAAQREFLARVPDVVFVDFDLAGVTGADFAKWIRNEAPAGRDVPIVATSAFEVDEVRQRCEEAGMDSFVVKPVTVQKVAAAIVRIEQIRAGSIVAGLQIAPAEEPAGFLDVLAEGDEARRAELRRSAWREVLTESVEASRALRASDLARCGQRAHRLVSAAQLLGLRDLVGVAREVNGAARSGDAPAAAKALRRLGRTVAALSPQFKK